MQFIFLARNSVVAIAVGVSVSVFVVVVCIPICVVLIIVGVVVGSAGGGRRSRNKRSVNNSIPVSTTGYTEFQPQPGVSPGNEAPLPQYQPPPVTGYQPSGLQMEPPKPYTPPHLHTDDIVDDKAPILQKN